jgi:two-component system sporulation sensor kinase A
VTASFLKDVPFSSVLEYLFENANDVIYILDTHGNLVSCNRKIEELTEFKRENFIGKSFREIISAKDLAKTSKSFLDVVSGMSIKFEAELKTASKTTIPVEVSSAPLVINGKIVGIFGIVRDITKRLTLERDLRETSKKLEMIFATAMEGITLVDFKENITFVNKAFADILGYSEKELIGMNLRKLVDEKSFEQIKRRTEARKKGTTERYELILYRKDGEPRIVQVSAAPLRSGDGNPIGSVGITMDVTEQKKAREVVKQSEEKYRELFDNARDPIFVLDEKGKILEINNITAEYGFKKNEILGKDMIAFVPKEYWPKILKDFAQVIQGKPSEGETEIITPRGKIVVEYKSNCLRKDGKIVGTQTILRDITERKKMEKKLQEYAEHLGEMVEERTRELKQAQARLLKSERLIAIGEVAAMVGHDLRNPLTGIAGAAYYLKMKQSPTVDPKTREMLKIIEKDIEYSNKIVNDLLDFSREIRLNKVRTTVQSMIKEALSKIKVPKKVKIIDFTDKASVILVDVYQMNRVFENIIKNAFDAMPKGGKLEIKSEKKGKWLNVIFHDTGEGVPKENLNKLGTPLFTTKAKGVGMGLAICRRLVEAHEGSISIESEQEAGTLVTVTLPVGPFPQGEKKIRAFGGGT